MTGILNISKVKKMKVILLAGGYGTRLSELTGDVPKPMVPIGDLPIIMHIMDLYSRHGFSDFIIAAGYKSDYIKAFFSKLSITKSDYTIDLATGDITIHKSSPLDWKVTIVDTGLNTMTGGRLKRLKEYIAGESFMMTYGDGIANVNINDVIDLHHRQSKLLTMTAVRPPARFGELIIEDDQVVKFEEKPQLHDGWINGGFFVCENSVLDYISGDNEMFEREPMEKLCRALEITAYKHNGYWQCMDSKKDYDKLNELWNTGSAPWLE
ncbi:Nucleotidyl transferase [marine gamma proteobacterium HTCC2207]|jgi:glucose-1-phosphate cytidylyltransferase|uniref:Nucleotidyl transferase n=1 Tax=gamma proteobacterium HTCC2207 TaxID=314287 RepID=Q1YPS2_9GAMM|nr:Nucleotidyl transferase [marine gamma proteobacterium HTCC2207] [gamma proteobacterium HTCC2207]